MPSIKPSHALLALSALLALALGGCGDKNDKAVFSPETGHKSGWVAAHKTTAQADPESCTECHGADLQGGITQTPCTQCHASAPVGSNAAGCTSCHGNPPDGSALTGNFPNRKLSHAAHANITNVTCSTCHNGYGYGSADHGTLASARMSLYSSFRAKQAASAPTYARGASGITCANVSCHGGKTTPVWGGTTGCTSCHDQGTAQGTPEYNSYYSGYTVTGTSVADSFYGNPLATNQHYRHLNRPDAATNPVACTDCHSVWKLTNQQHFGKLAAKTFGSPGNTLGNSNGGGGTKIGSYDATDQTCSIVTCHGDTSSSTIKWHWYRIN